MGGDHRTSAPPPRGGHFSQPRLYLREPNRGRRPSRQDAGPGVPDEYREGIFEPFRRGPEASTHSPGVGVRLALVARFAELHGGRAWLEQREGGGASFRVFLPGRMDDSRGDDVSELVAEV